MLKGGDNKPHLLSGAAGGGGAIITQPFATACHRSAVPSGMYCILQSMQKLPKAFSIIAQAIFTLKDYCGQ